MNAKRNIHVYSEIGDLKTVLLHRPGEEIENLIPAYMETLLFDDIPYLKVAQEEHDIFANTLRNNDVEVLYLEDLAAEVIQNKEIREKFIEEAIEESGTKNKEYVENIKKYLESMKEKDLVCKIMAGRSHEN